MIDQDTLALAAEYARDTDGSVADGMLEGTSAEIWESNPALAARLAYAQIEKHWEAQALAGVVEGVPQVETVDAPQDGETAVATAAA